MSSKPLLPIFRMPAPVALRLVPIRALPDHVGGSKSPSNVPTRGSSRPLNKLLRNDTNQLSS